MKRLIIPIIVSSLLCCATSCISVKRPGSFAKTVYIKKAPKTHKVVYVNQKKYVVWNGKYHRKTSKGYVRVYLN